MSASETLSVCQNTVEIIDTKTTVEFPPKTYTVVDITQFQSTIVIPYTAKIYLGTRNSGTQEIITINGQYDGIYVSTVNIQTKTIPITSCDGLICKSM